jgi:hypothetical protein
MLSAPLPLAGRQTPRRSCDHRRQFVPTRHHAGVAHFPREQRFDIRPELRAPLGRLDGWKLLADGGLHPSTVLRIERGSNPLPTSSIRLVVALNCRPWDESRIEARSNDCLN